MVKNTSAELTEVWLPWADLAGHPADGGIPGREAAHRHGALVPALDEVGDQSVQAVGEGGLPRTALAHDHDEAAALHLQIERIQGRGLGAPVPEGEALDLHGLFSVDVQLSVTVNICAAGYLVVLPP